MPNFFPLWNSIHDMYLIFSNMMLLYLILFIPLSGGQLVKPLIKNHLKLLFCNSNFLVCLFVLNLVLVLV